MAGLILSLRNFLSAVAYSQSTIVESENVQIPLFIIVKCKAFGYDVFVLAKCIRVNRGELPATRVERPDLDTFVTGARSYMRSTSTSCICDHSQDLPTPRNPDRVDGFKSSLTLNQLQPPDWPATLTSVGRCCKNTKNPSAFP